MAFYIELWALLAALFILYLLIRFIKNPIHILANSIVGVLLFFLVNAIFSLGIPINIFSVGVVAIGGLTGFVLVLLLHLLGLGF